MSNTNWGTVTMSGDLDASNVRRGTFDRDTIIIEAPGTLHITLSSEKANGLLRALTLCMYTEGLLDEETADVLREKGTFTLMSIEDARAAQGPDDLAGDDE
jgi:hypothetical protein